ncbi:DMT family transporter [Roseovarius rhodophyticola]|uniref:DMT family transporter n=1 Tax=Roseovarius rhodophyticola TaxID=3080827 RepID=A0ABZ2TF84_9RHOB|nr:DMT family transporter [Roseovarius sp. W115]MDV2928016.1 DMT family transporter [Roseovarius sp. W115]
MDNLRGIIFVIVAMAGFTIEDMFIKQLSTTLPVGQILIVLGVGSGAIFATLSLLKGQSLTRRQIWQPMFLWRALSEAIAAICFATALSLVDISVVASVFQATPLVITMGAALFLGEKVGWRRWSAIFIGFIGVLMIIRPGLDGFDPNALLVLGSVLFVTVRDLITRKIAADISSTVISFQGFAALIPAGIILLWMTGEHAQSTGSTELWMLLGGVIFGAIGYYGIVQGMRLGDAAVVTPFRYTRLLFSLLVGIVVFQETPDALTLIGAALIISTGLFTFLRERQLAKAELA